jgi:small-conductance mechanosensitive channel
LQNMRAFLGAQAGGADLLGFVDRLERSVPEAARGAQQPAEAAPAAGPAPFRPESAGIFALVTESISLSRARSQLDDALADTDSLRKSYEQTRAPLVADLTAGIRRADAAVADSASQTAEQIDADRREIESLSARFKLLSAAVAPLREHGNQVDVTKAGLVEQRRSTQERYASATTRLLFRAGGLAVAILLILGVSELWRRGTFRYVRDPRRRKQFLVLRRVVVSGVIFAVIAIGLVNEVGSMATYAGFLTAGLAVALQNPIASVVAYFFLIGRYGLRVGDRVTISGVTGDVVEIGLVRLYLMEMTGAGADLHPTGRVVGFSNSVLFQPAAIFRQMPGADYAWHAAAVILAPETDPQTAEARLSSAVTAALEPYRERVEQQHAAFQRLVDVPVAAPQPVARLRHTSGGLEFLVRYPADMRQASTTDDRVLEALDCEIAREPRLAATGAPRLHDA